MSGGKDSIYAIYKAQQQGDEVVCLITLKSKRADSYMFHIPNIHMASMIAEAMGLPLISEESSGVKEKELDDMKRALKMAKEKYGIAGVTSGALASQYQYERVGRICDELGLKSVAPLWQADPESYIKELIANNFKAIITGIAADGLTEAWLGTEINEEFLRKIKKLHVHYGGEGGEYESLVLDCPLFNKKIKVVKWHNKMENKCTGHYLIDEAVLEEKLVSDKS